MQKLKNFFQFVNNPPFTVFEERIVVLFKNWPKLTPEIIHFIVSFGPYLILIGGILSFLTILTLFSIGTVIFYTFAPMTNFLFPYYYIYVIGAVAAGIMLVLSFNDLQERKLFGWRLVFWAANINIVSSLLSLNVFGAILGALISWYILTQIKFNYT